MAKGEGPLRRVATRRVGVFVAVLALALSIPSIAFAANTATFSGVTPKAGSSTTSARPTISVIVYDRYGVKGSSNYSMTLDGVKVGVKISYYSGFGSKKFKLSYKVPTNLSAATHKVAVKVKDLRARSSSTSWSFAVIDKVAPVTTSDVAGPYTGSATIRLSATDNTRVAHTYYSLDFGPRVEGTVVTVATPGNHTLAFWSVDAAGNTESVVFPRNLVGFVVNAAPTPFVHATPVVSCTVTGCHNTDLASIHIAKGCGMCHNNGVTPSNNCIGCHGSTPPFHTAATHAAIASVPTTSGAPSCTQAICHGTAAVTIHRLGCAECHGSSVPAVKAAIANGGATCETCHINATTPSFAAIHVIPAGAHTVAGACVSPQCHHYTDVSLIHTKGDDPPGCFVCHRAGITPTLDCAACHPNLATVHNFTHANASGVKSTVCTTCHGTDLPTAHNGVFTGQADLGCFCHTGALFDLSDEMAPLLAAGKAECLDCHKDPHAAHGFDNKVSGHNTTTYGTVGAYSKFDGSQGVLVKDSTGATITQEWPLPTASVFWSQAKTKTGTETPPATANTTVGWNSVITCQDCHTGLNLAGPHGASDNFGIDPNYAGDWTQAELTSWDPTGMRSILTTAGSPAIYYDPNTPGTGYSDRSYHPQKFICEKCHKLVSPLQGIPAQTRAGRSQQGFGWSNEVHMEHHGDQTRGQGNCVSCHIAIPHGWTRPRLLVYSSDAAPYKAPQPSNWFYGTAGTQYLDGVNASPAALKEIEATSSVTAAVGTQTVTFVWDGATGGVKWLGDPAGIPDPATGEFPAQNNCNACSAAGNTHVNPDVEAIPRTSPIWK